MNYFWRLSRILSFELIFSEKISIENSFGIKCRKHTVYRTEETFHMFVSIHFEYTFGRWRIVNSLLLNLDAKEWRRFAYES